CLGYAIPLRRGAVGRANAGSHLGRVRPDRGSSQSFHRRVLVCSTWLKTASSRLLPGFWYALESRLAAILSQPGGQAITMAALVSLIRTRCAASVKNFSNNRRE